METKTKNPITSGIFYEIRLTSRYIKSLASQLFKKFDIDMPVDNFAVLDFLTYETKLCQRDLAKIMFKDRASMGKIISDLEEKGYVKRTLETKGNMPVKMVELTQNGKDFVEKVNENLSEFKKFEENKILTDERENIIKSLKKIREFLKENIESKI